MANEQFNHAFDTWIAALPAAVAAVLGWVGHTLVNDDPVMNTRQFVGGVILSAFTGGCTCILLQSMGFPPPLAAVIASALGSSGIKGYEWLIQRSKENLSQKDISNNN